MSIDTIIFVIVFSVTVYLLGREMERRLVSVFNSRRKNLTTEFERLTARKEDNVARCRELEAQALTMFSLYEMTRDLTTHLQKDEVFECFRTRLRESVSFKVCHILDAAAEDLEKLKASPENYVFQLQWEGSVVGSLVVTGVAERDKEKVSILGHQLALALRRANLYREVERLATTDSLTQVFTRRHFMERYDEEFRRSQARHLPLTFLMLDVDHFKEFNDQHGHLVGDQILKEVARIVSANTREIDFVGRYGGEEFCVALPETQTEGAIAVAERIRSAVAGTALKAYDASLRLTVSIGIANFPRDAQELAELVDKSDWALYRAKQSGRNRVCAVGVYGQSK